MFQLAGFGSHIQRGGFRLYSQWTRGIIRCISVSRLPDGTPIKKSSFHPFPKVLFWNHKERKWSKWGKGCKGRKEIKEARDTKDVKNIRDAKRILLPFLKMSVTYHWHFPRLWYILNVDKDLPRVYDWLFFYNTLYLSAFFFSFRRCRMNHFFFRYVVTEWTQLFFRYAVTGWTQRVANYYYRPDCYMTYEKKFSCR